MNTFSHKFYIDDKPYTIFVDSSQDEYKKIIINNKEIVKEKYTLSLNRKAYIIYYPIEIDKNEIVISIDDTALNHSYNIYLNGVSLIDGTRLDERYNRAVKITENGFMSFVRRNWMKILLQNIVYMIASVIGLSVFHCYTTEQFNIRFLLIFIVVPLLLPVFIAGDWFHEKNIIKKYKNCFRPNLSYNQKTESDYN